jgi:hypothetical protein
MSKKGRLSFAKNPRNPRRGVRFDVEERGFESVDFWFETEVRLDCTRGRNRGCEKPETVGCFFRLKNMGNGPGGF